MKSHYLNDKQTAFFRRNMQMAREVEQQMRGALQMIVEEREITGRVRLNDDFTEIIEIEAELPSSTGGPYERPNAPAPEEAPNGMAPAR